MEKSFQWLLQVLTSLVAMIIGLVPVAVSVSEVAVAMLVAGVLIPVVFFNERLREEIRQMLMALKRQNVLGLSLFLVLMSGTMAYGQSGRAFRDFDSNGLQAAGEPGVEGIQVRLYANAGFPQQDQLIGTTVTGANGIYNFATSLTSGRAAMPGEQLRIEFDIPTSYSCDVSESVDFPSASGVTYGSSVQFIVGQQANVNFAMNYSGQTVTNPNPDVFIPCYGFGNYGVGGNVDNEPALVLTKFLWNGIPAGNNNGQAGVPSPVKLANIAQIGSTYGVAFSKQSQKVFVSACLRRHAAMGPLGPGGIYLVDPYTANPNKVSNFLSLDAIGINTQNNNGVYPPNPGNNTSPVSEYIGTNAQRGLPANN